MRPRWVMIDGVSQGVGKSTLANGLVDHLLVAGADVDHVPEEAMFSREEFAEPGTGYRTRRWATAEELLTGYRRLVARYARRR